MAIFPKFINRCAFFYILGIYKNIHKSILSNDKYLSENWNEYCNGQGCNSARRSRVLLRSNNLQITMFYYVY